MFSFLSFFTQISYQIIYVVHRKLMKYTCFLIKACTILFIVILGMHMLNNGVWGSVVVKVLCY